MYQVCLTHRRTCTQGLALGWGQSLGVEFGNGQASHVHGNPVFPMSYERSYDGTLSFGKFAPGGAAISGLRTFDHTWPLRAESSPRRQSESFAGAGQQLSPFCSACVGSSLSPSRTELARGWTPLLQILICSLLNPPYDYPCCAS